MWRFLRNRRLILCLAYIIFRALIYWAHRSVVPAIAWHLVLFHIAIMKVIGVNFLKHRVYYGSLNVASKAM